MRIIIPGRSPSWNKIYTAQKYYFRKLMVDQIHELVKYSLIDQKIKRQVFKNRVDITITAYFKSRPLDPDNIPAKIFIDGLKDYLLTEDNPRFVRKVTTESRVDKTQEEYVEIAIVEIL